MLPVLTMTRRFRLSLAGVWRAVEKPGRGTLRCFFTRRRRVHPTTLNRLLTTLASPALTLPEFRQRPPHGTPFIVERPPDAVDTPLAAGV
jgi:hypothetical protein